MPLIHGQAISSEELEASSAENLRPRASPRCAELQATLPGGGLPYASPYLGPGVNVLQFKQRDVYAQSRAKTVSGLKSELKGAAQRPRQADRQKP
jgi:hypothetical protein